jgi:patatin-like phospholipase/acyl hydrolase
MTYRNPESHSKGSPNRPNHPFRILSLDGGGIRGAFIASFLAKIEERLGHAITEHFDLIAGTSTGGIIAVALAFGEPCKRIRDFYSQCGPGIFTRRPKLPLPRRWKFLAKLADKQLKQRFNIDIDSLRQSKYDGMALRSALEDVFGERTLEQATKRLIIPSVDLTSGKTVVFKTPHQPNFLRDRHFRAVDVVLATTAAPAYFPHATISPGTAYTDGGVWANNPSMAAYVEAIKIREVCVRSGIDPIFTPEDIQILSIGTGRPNYSKTPPEAGAGIGWWAGHLLDVVFTSQAQGVDNQTRYVLGKRYHRVDFDIPDNSWALDSIDLIPKLLHIGNEKAAEQFAKLNHELFKSTILHPYRPFK